MRHPSNYRERAQLESIEKLEFVVRWELYLTLITLGEIRRPVDLPVKGI